MDEQDVRRGSITADCVSIIELLAKNLYPQRDMFIRELIQNAHDAILVRGAFGGCPPGRIDVVSDRDARTIVFRDNGAGMDEEEIVQYLATIGRSGTKEWHDRFLTSDRDRAQGLIGQFGIGILSAFVVAREIVVETRSERRNSDGLRWTVATTRPEWRMVRTSRVGVGTQVLLHLKPDCLGMSDPQLLREAVLRYADFLPIPIYVNSEGPVNTMHAPWHLTYSDEEDRQLAYSRYVERRFGVSAIDVIPVFGSGFPPVDGVLYVPDRAFLDGSKLGAVDVYQSRMFIRHGDRTILPAWVRFVGGVIDSPALTPTAARDAVQQDSIHSDIRNWLGRILVERLMQLAKEDRVRLGRLLAQHHHHVKAVALQFAELFADLAEAVLFEVSLRETHFGVESPRLLTLPEYCQLQAQRDPTGRSVINYISELGPSLQFHRLCEAKGLLAVNAASAFDEEFLHRYADARSDKVVVRRINIADSELIFEPLGEEERAAYRDVEHKLGRLLATRCPDQELVVRLERFVPTDMPAVLMRTRDRMVGQRLQRLAAHPGMPAALGTAMSEALRTNPLPRSRVILHVNTACDLIGELICDDADDPLVWEVWAAVFDSAAIYSRRHDSVQDVELLHAQMIRCARTILHLRNPQLGSSSGERELERMASTSSTPSAVDRKDHLRLCLLIPADEKYAVVERALRNVLEDEPYHFELLVCTRTPDIDTFRRLSGFMPLAAGFLAEVSDLDMNVMLQVGALEYARGIRHLILLRHREARCLPTALAGCTAIRYDFTPSGKGSTERDLIDSLRSELSRLESVRRLQRERAARFLSIIHLRRRLGRWLSDQELDHVRRAFPTIEALESASQASVQSQATLGDPAAAVLKRAFSGDRS